ncbi:hypothetical protein LJC42_02780 [Eubacteriales bacterium OttesenSCG-928-K08]|nr:hypothetical protein [Eubacteriales bacterium OttesenSCG-928-K08]
MKKLFATIAVFLLTLMVCTTAYAATFQAVTDPATVTGAGRIIMRFTVTNDSTVTMRNLSVSGYGISTSTNALEGQFVQPGAALTFYIRDLNITDDMLGETLLYTLSWTEDGQAYTKDVEVGIGADALQAADMTATRTVSKPAAREGEKVTLTYTLNNPGSVGMSNITLRDEGIAGANTIATGLVLDGGTSRTVTYEYTLGQQDATSNPTITYTINDEAKALVLEPLIITLTNVHLQVDVSQTAPAQDGVVFTIILTNDGNQAINNLTITDDQANKVTQSPISVAPGATQTVTYAVQSDAARNVTFNLKGTDALNQPYEDNTTSFEVRPYVDPSNVTLSLLARSVEALSQTGHMKVRFEVQNDSSVDITGVTIVEEQLGAIITRDILPRGQTIYEEEIYVGDPRELKFTLQVSDPSGAEHSYTASITAAHMELATPTPDGSLVQEDGKGGGSVLTTVLVVLASLLALAGIALLALSVYEKKRNAGAKEYEFDDEGFAPTREQYSRQRRASASSQQEQSNAYLDRNDTYGLHSTPQEQDTVRFSMQDDNLRDEEQQWKPPARQNVGAGYSQQQEYVQEDDVKPYVPTYQRSGQEYVPPEYVAPAQEQPPADYDAGYGDGRSEVERPRQPVPNVRNRVYHVRPTDENEE